MKNLYLIIYSLVAVLILNGSLAFGSTVGFVSDLPNCDENTSERHNCFGGVEKDGITYIGEFQNNKPFGMGEVYLKNGHLLYRGNFKGRFHGSGTWYEPEGWIYIGNWYDGKKNGAFWEFKTCDTLRETTNFNNLCDWSYLNFKDDEKYGLRVNSDSTGNLSVINYSDDVPGGVSWIFTVWWKQNGANICRTNLQGKEICKGKTAHDVFPDLKRAFNSLSRQKRKRIQTILSHYGMYNSEIDGEWGRNTLAAIAQFSVIHFKNFNLDEKNAAAQIPSAILDLGMDGLIDRSKNAILKFKEFMGQSSLAKCNGSPTEDGNLVKTWTECVGIFGSFDTGLIWSEYKDGVQNGIFAIEQYLNPQKLVDNCNGEKRAIGSGTLCEVFSFKSFVGKVENAKYSGPGTLTYWDGEEITGVWENNKFIGTQNKLIERFSKTEENSTTNEVVDNLSMPRCPEKQEAESVQWHDCVGTLNFKNGDEYTGEFANRKFHGVGTLTYADGTIYEGSFKEGKFHGYGELTDSNGDSYRGDFKNDKFNGPGIVIIAKGNVYEGTFVNGYINGQGTFKSPDGTVFNGTFKDGKYHGQGELIQANGNKYKGMFSEGTFFGEGTYTFRNGDEYTGRFENDEFNGVGILNFSNGDTYSGEFKNDKFEGTGTFSMLNSGRFENRDEYIGGFRNNQFEGEGVFISYSNGAVVKKIEGVWESGELIEDRTRKETYSTEILAASSGSGFAVSSDGYVITNHHVIDGCDKVVVHTKGKELPVTVVTYDPQNDLALLKGDFNPPTVFPLSNTRPELLQDIYVAGFPFGDKFSTSVKVTKGIVSSLTGLGNNFSNIQIDAALQSGNSGGPILDDFGNVVAVALAKLDAKYMFEEFGIIPENTNFGIKSSVVRSVLDSNSVNISSANKLSISKSQLGEMISSGTYYISCWMTMAQIEKMKTKKVFFSNLD